MSVTVVALTFSGRYLFLLDFIRSFEECARPDTQLVLGIQGQDEALSKWFWTEKKPENIYIVKWEENLGLNRYDELVEKCSGDIICDTDDDSLLFPGFETIFEDVLAHESFGWVGIPVAGSTVTPFEGGKDIYVSGYHVVPAPVGGGLAATRMDVWGRVGGFGVGRTSFDPEDARYQRKCIQAGYATGMIVEKNHVPLSYVHHGEWEWHIKYGTVDSKIDSLLEAHRSGFITLEQYQANLQQYLAALDEVKT